MRYTRLLALSLLAFSGLRLSAGELPVDIQAKLLKIIANGAGSAGKVACKDPDLKAALEAQGMTVDDGAKVVFSNMGPQIKTFKTMGRLVVCGRPELLQQGASICIAEDGGKPKIFLNPMNIKASGVQLSDAIMKAASL